MDKPIAVSKWRLWRKWILMLIALLLVLVCYWQLTAQSYVQRQNVMATSLTIMPVIEGSFTEKLTVRGVVTPVTSVYLDTIAGGQIEQKFVQQGEFVRQGQPLLKLTNTQLQLDVMSREAQVTEQLNFLRNTQMTMETNRLNLKRDLLEIELQINHLQRKLSQAEKLLAQQLIAADQVTELSQDLAYFKARKALTIERQQQENSIRQLQLSQLEDSAQMLQSNLVFARQNLDNLLVKAPVTGYLSELSAEVGESKPQGARLGKVDLTDDYKLVVGLDEFYLPRISLGMPVVVHYQSQPLKLKVSKIDSSVKLSQFHIEILLPPDLKQVNNGQAIELELIFGQTQTKSLLLSRGAFAHSTGGYWAFVVSRDGQRAQRKALKLGKMNQDYYQVESGLALGDRVIVSSYQHFDQAQQLIIQ